MQDAISYCGTTTLGDVDLKSRYGGHMQDAISCRGTTTHGDGEEQMWSVFFLQESRCGGRGSCPGKRVGMP